MEGSATTRTQARSLCSNGAPGGSLADGDRGIVATLIRLASAAHQIVEDSATESEVWGDHGDATERQAAVRQRLDEMLDVLRAAQASASADRDLRDSLHELTTSEAAQRAVALLTPLAQEHDVEVVLDIQAAAGHLQAGPLAQVMLTGLRNAIDACAANRMNRRCVELSLTLSRHDELVLHISDTGSGVPRRFDEARRSSESDHSAGLDACRRMVDSLGGRMELVNVPFGAGAVLKVTVSAQRLRTS